METNIPISNLNDFVFCPRSIYFHNLYSNFDEHLYHDVPQVRGKNSHEAVDKKRYSTKSTILHAINIYSEELGVFGKIDILDTEKHILTERKHKIKKIYDGYLLQLHAQYFCLIEMGFKIKKIQFYSLSDNKVYDINLPNEEDKKRLKDIIKQIKSYSLEDPFSQNPNKCKMCIYKQVCDIYNNDEQT